MSREDYLPEDWTPLQRASYATVHDYRRGNRRGAPALAPLVGKTPTTLSNEVNPVMDHHKFGLEDSIVVQHASGDLRIAQSYCMELGGVFVHLPPLEFVSDAALLSQFADWQAALGHTAQAIHDALDDQRIDLDEVDRIRLHFNAHMAKGLAFLACIESIAEESDE